MVTATVRIISPEEIVENVRECLRDATRRLGDFGMTPTDARRLRSARVLGRRSFRRGYAERLDAAVAFVDTLAHYRDVCARLAAGRLGSIRDDGMPF